VARALLKSPDTMDAIDTQLATAEFEETWLEVRYHEGRATVAEVELAIRRVNTLRRLADRAARASGCEVFARPATAARWATRH
jgi:hypothetical protein